MRLGKETGGCSLSWGGKTYTWAKDGSVIQVPRELADDLLSIRGAGYFDPPAAEAGPAVVIPPEVTEPAPPAKAAVTEPAPKGKAAVTEGPAAKA
jgi:hypothetical protein